MHEQNECLRMIAVIGTSDQPWWLEEAYKILLSLRRALMSCITPCLMAMN